MSDPTPPIAGPGQSPPTEGSPPFRLTAFGHECLGTSSGGTTDIFQMIVVTGFAPVPDGMWPVFEMQPGTDPDVLPLRIVFVKQVSTPPLDPGFGGNCNYGIALAKFGPNGWAPAKQLKVTHPELGDLIVEVEPLTPWDK